MKSYKFLFLVLIFSSFFSSVFAQFAIESYEKGWHLKDPASNFYGIKLEEAYKVLLKNRTPKKKIIVAVIDSGIDTAHEDLKPVLWRNEKEIPGNSIDDDKNGYVDDIHGWNFIGGKDGSNVGKDSYEAARVYHKYKPEFENNKILENSLSADKKKAYQLYTKAKYQLEAQAREAEENITLYNYILSKLTHADSILQLALGKDVYTGDELANFSSIDANVSKERSFLLGLFQQMRQMERTNSAIIGDLMKEFDGEKSKIQVLSIAPKQYRAEIVKDNYDDPKDRFYGNNDVMGTDADHGTHVAGIIGASRTNNIGINGVADFVSIMPLRAVPDGDEHDKDIALAIRYAVDNGAKIINMSFGKAYSSYQKEVYQAMVYADSLDVLLVHAAGNDHKNIDVESNYPAVNYVFQKNIY